MPQKIARIVISDNTIANTITLACSLKIESKPDFASANKRQFALFKAHECHDSFEWSLKVGDQQQPVLRLTKTELVAVRDLLSKAVVLEQGSTPRVLKETT
jgi:hypothetical protein